MLFFNKNKTFTPMKFFCRSNRAEGFFICVAPLELAGAEPQSGSDPQKTHFKPDSVV